MSEQATPGEAQATFAEMADGERSVRSERQSTTAHAHICSNGTTAHAYMHAATALQLMLTYAAMAPEPQCGKAFTAAATEQ